jgi:hypothetical protein
VTPLRINVAGAVLRPQALHRSADDRQVLHPVIEGICDAKTSISSLTIDDELPIFGRSMDDSNGWESMWPSPAARTSHICNDKYETYLFCQANGIKTPVTRLKPMSIRSLNYPFMSNRASARQRRCVFSEQPSAIAIVPEYVPTRLFRICCVAPNSPSTCYAISTATLFR